MYNIVCIHIFNYKTGAIMEIDTISMRVRKSTGLTQKKFAKKYGIPVSTVRKHDQKVVVPGQVISNYYKLIEKYPIIMANMIAELV
jgi:DNA-binding transcriptional regulator YiaG